MQTHSLGYPEPGNDDCTHIVRTHQYSAAPNRWIGIAGKSIIPTQLTHRGKESMMRNGTPILSQQAITPQSPGKKPFTPPQQYEQD